MNKRTLKQNIYYYIVNLGIKVLIAVFPEYFAREPLEPSDRYIEYPFAIHNLPKPPGRLLDVGCAGSFFPLILAGFGYETFAIDIRKYSITNRIKFNNFTFINEGIEKTTFADNYFDAITAISTLEHIGLAGRYGISADLSSDRKAIKEMKRILKHNGVILLTIPFGKAKIVKPYCRIYDYNLVKQLAEGMEIVSEAYYMQDTNDDWHQCAREYAEAVNATPGRYALCLLKLTKK